MTQVKIANKAATAGAARAKRPLAQAPSPRPQHPLLQMQRTLGNRAVARSVQAKLRVGSIDDPHEREADHIANAVMRAHAPATRTSAETPTIRRLCQHCEESLRKREDGGLVERKAKAPGAAPETAVTENALTVGGQPLPGSVRAFYEYRFDRDFGGVRIHTGPLAERYADDFHAHAFTYGRHVWMGRGQRVEPSFLLAHELAHVVQQEDGAPGGPRRLEKTADVKATDNAPVVRRFSLYYWEPYEFDGNANHRLVLPAMGKENNIFTEAPVPNASTKGGFGYNIKGRADFYRASTTIGVYYSGDTTPQKLASDRDLKKDGDPFPHIENSAPKTNAAHFISNAAKAPKQVAIGDLKPAHGTIEALEGPEQVENYKRGFEIAHRETVNPKTGGDGAAWTPFSTRTLGRNDLTVPAQFKTPFTGQKQQALVIKAFGKRPEPPMKPVMGAIGVTPDATNAGIWNYQWVPTTGVDAATLPPKVKQLGPKVTTSLIDPLIESPLPAPKTISKKSKPDALKRPARPETSISPGIVRRKETATAPEKDNFDYPAWTQARKDIAGDFGAEKKAPDFKDSVKNIHAAEATAAAREALGMSALPDAAHSKEAGKELSKIEFWTGALAGPFGFFRKVFGTTFVKIAQFFIKLRNKARDLLKKLKLSASVTGGFLGAALKAAFRGLKMIASFVVGRVVNRLMQSLVTGVTNKIKAIIGSDVQEELERKAADVAKLREELERKATETVDALLDRLFGVHIQDFNKLREITEIVGKFVELIGLVRWGARVVACLSPPAFGCLWILAEAALDYAAQKVAETCWFQEKIQPLLAKVDYVTTKLPNLLADGLISKLKGILPAALGDVFADLDTGEIKPQAGDVECDADDKKSYQDSPLHKQIDDLYLKLGPERAAALQLLASKMDVPKDRPLTADDIKRMQDTFGNMDPAKLQAYAETYPARPEGVPESAAQNLAHIENPAKNAAPPDPEPAAPDAPVSKQEGSQVSSDSPSDQKGDDKQTGEGGGMNVVDARDRATTKKGDHILQGVIVKVVNTSWKHTRGDKVAATVIIWQKGDAKVMIRNIETVVGTRFFFPRTAKSENEASAVVIPYKVMKGVSAPEVGGIIPTGWEIRGLIETRGYQQAREAQRQQQAKQAAK